MITFPYIEDYLEVLGGYRAISAQGRSPGPATLFGLGSGPVSLARYDVGIVQSMAGHTVNNGSLTDRQSELVVKIIGKYRRQFRNHGVDVEPSLNNPQFRNPVRVIDRTRSFSVQNDTIVARFPYDKTIINFFITASKENRGSCQFDRDQRQWVLGFTTYNVNWAVSIAREYGFAVDSTLNSLMSAINELEQIGYDIALIEDQNQQLQITNAAPSLLNYIHTKIGSIHRNNIIRLVDYASVLGYRVSDSILNSVKAEHDPITVGFLLDRQIHYGRNGVEDNSSEFLAHLRRYMQISGRGPVYIYEPDASDRLKLAAKSIFNDQEIVDISNARTNNYLDNPDVKCVYFNKIKKSMRSTIPLLVSTNAMLYGANKQYMLQLAEKVVYYTSTTLNKEAKTIAGEINHQG